MTVVQKPSPNHSTRPTGEVSLLVLHADAGTTEQGTIAWILNPQSQVSYHYFIGRHGVVVQFVADDRKAWHAGVSSFEGRPNCNDYSLGVSFANDQRGEPFTTVALDAGVALVADLCRRHAIPVTRITTHAAIAPGRKKDPGPLFGMADFLARVEAAL